MKTLAQQIEEIIERMNQMAVQEQGLVHSLSDALNEADRRLLDDIRAVTIEHETRRGMILGELQTLADRVGLLPRPSETVGTLEAQANGHRHSEAVEEVEAIVRGGDWREAVIKIADEYGLATKTTATH